jgi:hypothetical protein
MQTREAIRRLCGVLAAGGLGAEILYLSLSAPARAEIDERLARLGRGVSEKSVNVLNYCGLREIRKTIRERFH